MLGMLKMASRFSVRPFEVRLLLNMPGWGVRSKTILKIRREKRQP